MDHICHARGCKVEVHPRMLMCARHWHQVPKDLKRGVWNHYVNGQERRKDPTRAYLDAADAAIKAVWKKGRKKREAARQDSLF